MVNNNNYYIVSIYEEIMVFKLEEQVKSLIGHKLITSITGSVSDRTKRRMEAAAEEAYKILKNSKKKVVTIKQMKIALKWSDEQVAWARNMNLALEEFRQTHPEWGAELDKTIAIHRGVRRAYLEFEGNLFEGDYIQIIQDVVGNLPYRKASQVYNSILIMEKGLKKERGINRIILPE